MSLRYGLRTARDLFDKLRRDLGSLETQVSSDQLFNFVVTARHLPEWVERDPTVPQKVVAGLPALRASSLYKACRDIADASKHFELTNARAERTNVSEVSSAQGYGVGRFGAGEYGVGEESIKIVTDDGNSIDALDFAKQVTAAFERVLDAT